MGRLHLALVLIHKAVGTLQDLRELVAFFIDGHSRSHDRTGPHLLVDLSLVHQCLQELIPVLVICALKDDDEFISAYPEHRAVLIYVADQAAGTLDGFVAVRVSPSVVDLLKVIDIAHDHAVMIHGSCFGILIDRLYGLAESSSVLYARELVSSGHHLGRLEILLLFFSLTEFLFDILETAYGMVAVLAQSGNVSHVNDIAVEDSPERKRVTSRVSQVLPELFAVEEIHYQIEVIGMGELIRVLHCIFKEVLTVSRDIALLDIHDVKILHVIAGIYVNVIHAVVSSGQR